MADILSRAFKHEELSQAQSELEPIFHLNLTLPQTQ